MPFSYTESVGDGTVTTFTAPPHLDSSHLTVSVDGVVKTITTDYVVSGTQVTFTVSHGAPANNTKVLIQRNSSRSTRLTDYSDSSVLTADALDKDANQIFYIAQESFDSSDLDSAQIVLNTAAIATKANDNEVVKLTGNQTISGDKTFSSDSLLIPSSSVIQLGDNQTSQIGEFSTLGLNNNATTLTDSLKVFSSNIVLNSGSSGKTYITSGNNSDVNLEVDNTGINVTGDVNTDGVNLTAGTNKQATIETKVESDQATTFNFISRGAPWHWVLYDGDGSTYGTHGANTYGAGYHSLMILTDTDTIGAGVGQLTLDGSLYADTIRTNNGVEVSPVSVVVSTNTVPTVAINKKYINTYSSGVNAYTLPSGKAGQMITFVNASSQDITLNRNTNSITLSKVIAGNDPANVTDNTITVGKSGTVEVVYTADDTAVIFGSGLS